MIGWTGECLQLVGCCWRFANASAPAPSAAALLAPLLQARLLLLVLRQARLLVLLLPLAPQARLALQARRPLLQVLAVAPPALPFAQANQSTNHQHTNQQKHNYHAHQQTSCKSAADGFGAAAFGQIGASVRNAARAPLLSS